MREVNNQQTVNQDLKLNVKNQFKNTFLKTIDNPVVKAQITWEILQEQLCDILGPEIHQQWFAPIRPLILKNNILLLQAQNSFASQWINTHYQQLVETLLLTQDKRFSCFFISPAK